MRLQRGESSYSTKRSSFDKTANRKLIQRLVGITATNTCNVTSIIDDRPASRIFLNTWVINLLVASQTIMLET
jgi:hypothetical protein